MLVASTWLTVVATTAAQVAPDELRVPLVPCGWTSMLPTERWCGASPGRDASGASGEARLIARGGRTEVIVTLRGMPPNDRYGNHLHPEPCSDRHPGLGLFRLNDLSVDSSGSATAATVLPAPLADVRRGVVSLVVHSNLASAGFPALACGELPRSGEPADPAAVPHADRLPRGGSPASVWRLAGAGAVLGLGTLLLRLLRS